MELDRYLQLAIEHGASDLHLAAGHPPILRVDGDIRPLDAAPLSGTDIRDALLGLLDEPRRATFEAELEIDFAHDHPSGTRFRVAGFANCQGSAAVFRAIPGSVPSLDALGAPPVVARLAALTKGLVLVTGPTGSGKSTTLAALIDRINSTSARHVLTVEDPIEFVHRSSRCLINQREVGRDTHSFARALRSALRADPDVILVGEMRDHETITLALTAAETGHLVLGTLHTTSAAKTVDRLIDVMPSADKPMVRAMLSSSLQAVIAQTLLKRADRPGRVAAYEVLIGTPAVGNLIRENQIAQISSMMQTGTRFGMQLLADAVQALVRQGTVRAEEARRALAAVDGEPRLAAGHDERAGAGFAGGAGSSF